MICGMTYYQICWYFILYSFLGWVVEVIFHAMVLGKVINRGFLNGPLCPVYGFGMLSVLASANAVEQSGLLAVRSGSTDGFSTLMLFIGGVVLATAVELIAGWLLDVAFHTRWWDYSDKPFNFHGYICLEFSVLWGLGITMIVRIIQPMIEASSEKFHEVLPHKYGWIVLAVVYSLTIADVIITTMTVIGLNKKLKQLDEVREKMRIVSDSMSEMIGTSTIKTSQVIGEGQVQAALAKAELKDAAEEKSAQLRREASAKYREAAEKYTAAGQKLNDQMIRSKEEAAAIKAELENQLSSIKASLMSTSITSGKRLLKAFPKMRSRDYNEQLSAVRELFTKTRKH